MTAFRVGMKVACLGGVRIGGHGVEAVPVKGCVYTIREFGSDGGIRLAEIVNPPLEYIEGFVECTFAAESFRPIVSRPTSIAVFQAMLTGKKAGVEA